MKNTTFKAICAKCVTICLLLLTFNSLHAQVNPENSGDRSLYHVLLFTWKEGTTKKQINEIKHLWKGLVKEVDGFESFEMNEVITENFDHVVILRFASKVAMETYIEHKDHKKLAEVGPAIVEGFSEFDYWD